MRHGVKLKKLGRDHSHRKALIANMIKSFIKNEKMITTVEKAKALKPFIEKTITRAKNDTTANRRLLFSRLGCKQTIDKLFEDVSKRYETRPGGYTRVFRLYNRRGDNASMALIELVEETITPNKKKIPSPSNPKKVSATKKTEAKAVVSVPVIKDEVSSSSPAELDDVKTMTLSSKEEETQEILTSPDSTVPSEDESLEKK